MDEKTNNALDHNYRNIGVINEGNKTISTNETILQATYDDTMENQLFWNQPSGYYKQNSTVLHEQKTRDFKKFFVQCVLSIIPLILGVTILFVVFCQININSSQGTPSPKNNPVLNSTLCDPVNPYYDSSWFTPSPTNDFICDVPIEISEIHIEHLTKSVGPSYMNCMSKLGCMSLIGRYIKYKDCKFTFFIDFNSNVYQAREWLCPFLSGQLWVGVISEDHYPTRDSEVQRILKHFNTEIVSYGEQCEFLNISGVNYNYINTTS